MKTIQNNQRTINILNKAIANGFEFEHSMTIEAAQIEAEDFLIQNEIDVKEEQCEVRSLGNHGQRVDWSDGKGFDFWAQGQITDWLTNGKFVHSTIIDSEANVVKLYDIHQ